MIRFDTLFSIGIALAVIVGIALAVGLCWLAWSAMRWAVGPGYAIAGLVVIGLVAARIVIWRDK